MERGKSGEKNDIVSGRPFVDTEDGLEIHGSRGGLGVRDAGGYASEGILGRTPDQRPTVPAGARGPPDGRQPFARWGSTTVGAGSRRMGVMAHVHGDSILGELVRDLDRDALERGLLDELPLGLVAAPVEDEEEAGEAEAATARDDDGGDRDDGEVVPRDALVVIGSAYGVRVAGPTEAPAVAEARVRAITGTGQKRWWGLVEAGVGAAPQREARGGEEGAVPAHRGAPCPGGRVEKILS
jgi:hypothetical protein